MGETAIKTLVMNMILEFIRNLPQDTLAIQDMPEYTQMQ